MSDFQWSSIPTPMIFVFILVVLSLLISSFLRTPFFKGMLGEYLVNLSLRRFLNTDDYRLLKDLTLPSGDGTTQIDHIVVSRFGLFVIETKNMKGWIFGNANQAQWTQVIFGHKTRFQNPIRQNYKHVKVVQDLLGIEKHQIHSLVAFVGTGALKTETPAGVVWGARTLAQYIKSKGDLVIAEGELDGLVKSLTEYSLQPSFRTRREHIKHVKALVAKKQDDALHIKNWNTDSQPVAGKCPRCGAEFVERSNRKSGERFLGCSRYPKCRNPPKRLLNG